MNLTEILHLIHFYSRPREGGDVVAMLWKYWYCISIHAPAKGATDYHAWVLVKTKISIHAPAKGATMNLFNLMFHFRISIHAPAKGATRKVIGCTVIFGISIHAPAKGATLFLVNKKALPFLFLFTPPRRGRQHTFIIFISICVQLLSIMHNAISLLFIFRT